MKKILSFILFALLLLPLEGQIGRYPFYIAPVIESAEPELIDSYDEANRSTSYGMDGGFILGQTFTTSGGYKLTSAKFYLRRIGSPTGNVIASLYATTGTPGTNAKPTGSALAVSDNVDAMGIDEAAELVTFTFSGANQYEMSDATTYAVIVASAGSITSNVIACYLDATSPTHEGTEVYSYDGTNWYVEASGNEAVCFYIYGIAE